MEDYAKTKIYFDVSHYIWIAHQKQPWKKRKNNKDVLQKKEKKRNEILQMKMLKPNFAILDEIDSGLDVDALRIVGENVNNMRSDDFGALVITHYQRLLDYIDVDYVHIMMNGRIVRTGGKELIAKIDAEGYDWLKEELGLEDENTEDKRQHVVLGSCAIKNKTENK